MDGDGGGDEEEDGDDDDDDEEDGDDAEGGGGGGGERGKGVSFLLLLLTLRVTWSPVSVVGPPSLRSVVLTGSTLVACLWRVDGLLRERG